MTKPDGRLGSLGALAVLLSLVAAVVLWPWLGAPVALPVMLLLFCGGGTLWLVADRRR